MASERRARWRSTKTRIWVTVKYRDRHAGETEQLEVELFAQQVKSLVRLDLGHEDVLAESHQQRGRLELGLEHLHPVHSAQSPLGVEGGERRHGQEVVVGRVDLGVVGEDGFLGLGFFEGLGHLAAGRGEHAVDGHDLVTLGYVVGSGHAQQVPFREPVSRVHRAQVLQAER